jgi:isopenicillin N synthase-like dioxygenase
MTTEQEAELVVIEYDDVTGTGTGTGTPTNEALLAKLDQAFGSEGSGIIGIRNVPGFVEAKYDVLSLAYPLAHLGEHNLSDLEDPNSLYNAGWSHGKEKLRADVPDTAKASFYFNPIIDIPGAPEDREKYPVSYPTNRWPTKSLPALEPAAKRLGCLMKDVAVCLSKHIDSYALSRNKHYQPETLYKTMVDTEKVKGRLLYYYPLQQQDASSPAAEDSWIGWHNDSGFLTALAGDMYMTPSGTILEDSTSSAAGLYIVDRNDKVRKISVPKDCMAIQIGECTQIITGGVLVATPHCVKGAPNLARASLACFIDTPPSFRLSVPGDIPDLVQLSTSSSRVPSLRARWKDGMTFGDFLQTTFQTYYDYNQ